MQEKLWLLKWPDLAPDTLITRELPRIKDFMAKHGGRAVIKPWDGNGGRGIFVLEEGDRKAVRDLGGNGRGGAVLRLD